MTKFYCMAKAQGSVQPKYIHTNYEDAEREALRLHAMLDCEIQILQIVTVIKKEVVPVTELKTKVIRIATADQLQLPF